MQSDKIFGVHSQALRVRARRAEVLAANMANADTPGYKARDIDFKQVLQRQTGPTVRLAATRPGHIQPAADTVPAAQLKYRVPQQAAMDGNTVELEAEQAQFSTNAMQYQATLRFLDGKIQGLLTALKGN